MIVLLFIVSIALVPEPMPWITFGEGPEWSVTIGGDGSARILYGSSDAIQSPPGSFDLKKIDAALGPLVTTDPGPERGVGVYSSLRTGPVVKDQYYTENIGYLKKLVEEVFEKSWINAGDVERYQKRLEKHPPMGVQLYFDERQILRREDYTGPPIRLRRPPPLWERVTRCYPLAGKYPVLVELLCTPWPYVALLILLGVGARRYRLNRLG